MRLADEFFFIAWDTAGSGAPVLHAQATALGLAGAVLGELTLLERITVRGAGVGVISRKPVEDALAQGVLQEMSQAPEHHDVRTWLAYLARDITGAVAARLQAAGLVEREEYRMLWRKHVRYRATVYARGAWPAVRMQLMLVKGHQADVSDMALAALIEATGLFDAVVPDPQDRPAARHYLSTLMATTPPPLRDLAGHVHAAAGDAVLSYRS